MALIKVVRGESVVAEVYFYNLNGAPIAGTGPASFAIRDYQNNLIFNGTAQQDLSNTARWYTQFTMPLSVPISNSGQKYQIAWALPTLAGDMTAIERFEVFKEGDPIRDINNTDIIMLEGGRFSDSLSVDKDLSIGTLNLKVFDTQNNLVLDAGDLPTDVFQEVNNYRVFNYVSNSPQAQLQAAYMGGQEIGPYVSVWEYTLQGGTPSYEFHSVYVVNVRAATLMDRLRKLIDRVRMGDIHPFLSYTDMDLVHYVMRGLEKVNGFPPQITYFTMRDVPQQFVDIVIKCAAVEALRAQYLAEGMSAFDFQGLQVQLNVDRTQYIDSLLSRLEGEVDSNLKSMKRLWARAGGSVLGIGGKAGVLGVSIGAYTNRVYQVSPWFWGHMAWRMGIPWGYLPIQRS